ncbi:MAG: AMP-binding protein, partial [Bacteroidales bacterium]|nr:AMP-binding protein [Bacteroidales bacterium]
MRTLVELFERSAAKFPNNILLKECVNGEYQNVSYREVQQMIHEFAAGLITLGVKPGDRIGLIAEGRIDWLVSELGMLYIGAVNVPLSIKLDGKTEVYFRLKHSGASMVIVSWTQVEKVEDVFAQLKDCKKIIYLDEKTSKHKHKLEFAEIKAAGKAFLVEKKGRETLQARMEGVQADTLANISYTSGTTADPKGIMLSHLNYAANVIQANTLIDIKEDDVTLTILPWDHSFAHTACLYSIIVNGAAIAAQEIGKTPMETLRNIPKNINQTRPTFMMSVPAVSKSFRKNIEGGIQKQGAVVQKLFAMGLDVAYKYNGNGWNKGQGIRAMYKPAYKLFDKLVFSKIRANFGGRLRFFIGGGALLDTELQRFFAAIGIPVCQGYGLSEASPVISSNTPEMIKFGSSGKLVKYMELKILDNEGQELPVGEKGEICIKGENVMLGYWNNPEASAEALVDGWLHTGDMGYMSKDEFLYVLGRFKSLLIGGDGEKFSPEGIEEAMVDQSPYIDQCMLYNNQNPYTAALVVPNIPAINRELAKKKIEPHHEGYVDGVLSMIEQEVLAYRVGGKYDVMFPSRWIPTSIAVLPENFNEDNQLL